MASSDVLIANLALQKVGTKSNAITSLTEGSPNANRVNTIFETNRDDLLRSHAWNFAVARQKLAQSTTVPVYEFDYDYPFPADWLRTLKVHDNEDGRGHVFYRLEGRSVMSSATEIWLTYIRQVTDTNDMTADFRKLFALNLAVDLAIPVANSKSLRTELLDEFRRESRRVKSADAIENFPEIIPNGSWITTRERTDDDELWNR